jgi:hypothetical protein
MRRTRPARRKLQWWMNERGVAVGKNTHYFLRSVSLIDGMPAKLFFSLTTVSLNTIMRPPITLKLRRKKVRSKMRPYPKP